MPRPFRFKTNPVFRTAQRWLSVPWNFLRWLLVSRPIRIKKLGLYYILFTIGVGAAAINTGNNLLYLILGLFLGFIVLSGLFSDGSLWGLHLSWESVEDLFAGTPARIDLLLQKGRFPAVMLSLQTHWSNGDRSALLVPWVSGQSERRFSITQTPPRRGRWGIDHLRLGTSFPFGLFEKFRRDASKTEWIVFPAQQVLHPLTLRAAGLAGHVEATGSVGEGSAPFLLRDYRPGESLRHIHWKASARRQRWILTEMEAEQSHTRRLWVPTWPHEGLEDFLSFLTSLILNLHKEGRAMALDVPGRFFPADITRPAVRAKLTYLALFDLAKENNSGDPGHSPAGAVDALSLWEVNRSREAPR